MGLQAANRAVAPAQGAFLSLFLIGDAGDPDPADEPVLLALAEELRRDPAQSFVVFLGDNVYPRGLPPPEAPDREEMTRRLDAQIDLVKAAGARGVFVPGNHDWEKGDVGGWDAVRRQGAYVAERGSPVVTLLPSGGCPGPEIVDLGRRVRVVALDTQWWLQSGPKPSDAASGCRAFSEEGVKEELRRALAGAGERHVVVAAHHPLASGGPHGGYFPLRAHLFPLTDLNRKLWIPLPFLGSIYPLSRKGGASAQDIGSARNRQMREAIEGVLRERPPLVYASGHEHTLQVIEGKSARTLLVSGVGIYGHTSAVRTVPGARFTSATSGFMRLDFGPAGVRLAVLAVDAQGKGAEVHAEWLLGGP